VAATLERSPDAAFGCTTGSRGDLRTLGSTLFTRFL
jgi:hypothetical protein